MGFYSFYRIFKDIIRTIFGNKAFKYFLIFAIICIVILFANKTFAVEPGNYVVDYYTTTYSKHSMDSTGTFYWFIPVFANSSYSISWSSGTELKFSFIDNLSRIEYTGNSFDISSSNFISSNNQGSYGYFAIKDGYLVVSQREYDFPNRVTLTILTDYDYTANLSTIHKDLYNFLYGEDLKVLSFSSINNLLATYNGSFASDNNYKTIYFPVKNGYKYSISYDRFNTTYNSQVRYGYCSSVPSVGSTYNTFNTQTTGFVATNNIIDFTANNDTYFYVSYSFGTLNNFSVRSNWSADTGGGINQQIINQGEETRDTLTDSNISQDTADYTLPSDNTNDITNDGFTSIFDRIRSTFTSGESTPATITIPFTNKSFTISKATVFGSAHLGVVQTIIECFWWFVVSLFIVKDIFKKIEKIKTGNIEFTETTNIKEDIL